MAAVVLPSYDVLSVFGRLVHWETICACGDGVVQPVVKTRDELAAQIAVGEPFRCEIVEEGQVLCKAGGVRFERDPAIALPEVRSEGTGSVLEGSVEEVL